MTRTPEQKEKNRLYMANRRASSEELRQYGRDNARAYNRSHREERKAYHKRWSLRQYGMTMEQFNVMLSDQDGKCAICGVVMDPPARATRDSVAVTVDHCHETGKVRGLLCYSCNLGLGIFKDSLRRVRSAVAYLEKHDEAYSNGAEKKG